MIFKKKLEDLAIVDVGNGHCYAVPMEVAKHINDLMAVNSDLMYRNKMLTNELEEIKPIVADPKFKQAVSKACDECKYALRSEWNREVLGCVKDNVCEDFVQRRYHD